VVGWCETVEVTLAASGSFGCGWRKGAPASAQDDRVWAGKGKQVPRFARNDRKKGKRKNKRRSPAGVTNIGARSLRG